MKITVLFVCLAVGGTISARLKRASGGEEITIKDAPYFVSVRRSGRHVCGAAFISTQHVLTAAHCVLDESLKPFSDIAVVSGTDVPDITNVGHSILNISHHTDYEKRRIACNIAVITLSAHVVWNEKQSEIALPNAEPRWYAYATLVGFKMSKSRQSGRGLRKLSVRMYSKSPTTNNPDDYGSIIYGTVRSPQNINNADLGTALVYEGRIIGIASERPNESPHACVFVNVLKFKTFIEESMEPTGSSWRPSVIDFDDIEWE